MAGLALGYVLTPFQGFDRASRTRSERITLDCGGLFAVRRICFEKDRLDRLL